MTAPSPLTLADVEAARERIRGLVRVTPVLPDDGLSEALGADVWIKAELLQRSGAFKVRGAFNRMLQLTPAEAARGVIAQSAGNHAQGVALVARHLGIRATIVMPERAPLTKVTATRRLGAEVILHGATYDDCAARAAEVREARGLTPVHPFDDDAVIAGQGTMGLEIADALPNVTTVVVPIGGGGLISGTAIALKGRIPGVRVVGVQAAGAASTVASLAAGHVVTQPAIHTIADGIAVKRPAERTLALIRQYVDEVVTVDDHEIAQAIATLATRSKLVAEGAGAAAYAALAAGRVAVRPGEVVCAAVCGGNIDANLLARVLDHAQTWEGRYLRLRTSVDDRPGALAAFLGAVAATGANVVDLDHRRSGWSGPVDRAGLDLTLEVRDAAHGEAVVAELAQSGYPADRPDEERWRL